MAEEQGTTEEQQQNELATSDVRNHELFKSAVGRLSKERDEMAAKLAQFEQSQAQAAKEKEIRDLEAKGNYEQVIKQIKDEKEQLAQQHQKEVTGLKLESALSRAGVNNKLFLDGAIARYDGVKEIETYVSELKASEENAAFFGQVQQTGQPAPSRAVPSGNYSSQNIQQIRQDLHSGDPKKAQAADKFVREYFKEHNKLPWDK